MEIFSIKLTLLCITFVCEVIDIEAITCTEIRPTEQIAECTIYSSNLNNNKKLKSFTLQNKTLSTIDETYFEKCEKLTRIDLTNNQLRCLPSKIFSKNTALKTIILKKDNLTAIDPNWFKNSRELFYLDLSDNFIVHLPIFNFLTMLNLKFFHISQNQIINFDEEKILESFPNLEQFSFQYNQISCSRHHALNAFFETKNITTNSNGYDENSREAHYEQEIKGIGCVLNDFHLKTLIGVSIFFIVLCLILISIIIYLIRKLTIIKQSNERRATICSGSYADSTVFSQEMDQFDVAANMSQDAENTHDIPIYATVNKTVTSTEADAEPEYLNIN
uniref:CSON006388 protein n=1 Tax=Culicoides sonorensis TaxID=179676 RepID=A0A336L7R8_CULSO